jgi:hypothetical protein
MQSDSVLLTAETERDWSEIPNDRAVSWLALSTAEKFAAMNGTTVQFASVPREEMTCLGSWQAAVQFSSLLQRKLHRRACTLHRYCMARTPGRPGFSKEMPQIH